MEELLDSMKLFTERSLNLYLMRRQERLLKNIFQSLDQFLESIVTLTFQGEKEKGGFNR